MPWFSVRSRSVASLPARSDANPRHPFRVMVRLAAGSTLALGLAGIGLALGDSAQTASAAVTTCAPSSAISGTTTTLTFTSVGTCAWSAPSGVSSFTVTLWGAAGAPGSLTAVWPPPVPGDQILGTGGEGAEVVATVAMAAGTSLELNVGGAGSTDDGSDFDDSQGGGINGGGDGTYWSGGGGGASDVRAGAFGPSDRVLVAGGGGGGGSPLSSNTGGNGGNADAPGATGGSVEGHAEGSPDIPILGGGGGGGSGQDGPTNGGAAGVTTLPGDECGTPSSPGHDAVAGGIGGSGSLTTGPGGTAGGGGGGGGYVGGGGGGSGPFELGDCAEGVAAGAGGGGGGSSYTGGADGIVPTGTSVSDPASPNAANGQIDISYSTAVVTTAPSTPTPTATLAFTGIDAAPMIFGGSGLVALGTVILAGASWIRRRRPRFTI
jgi:hypothetical protein